MTPHGFVELLNEKKMSMFLVNGKSVKNYCVLDVDRKVGAIDLADEW